MKYLFLIILIYSSFALSEEQNSLWSISTSTDEMTGKLSAYAFSSIVVSSPKMGFPYNYVNSRMLVGCNSEDEWIYFWFSQAPNLANTKNEDGYNIIRTRIKWDDKVEKISLRQEWSSNYIHFRITKYTIPKIKTSNHVLLELKWHGEKSVYFKYTLNGSSKAIEQIRTKCAKNTI